MSSPGPGSGPDTGAGSSPESTEPADRAPEDGVGHSALVGFMSVPVSTRFPLRRSTLLMAVAFIGLATLLYFNPAQSSSPSSGVVLHTPQGDVFVPNATPVSTTPTTTMPPTTTTAVAPLTTTSQPTVPTSTTTTSTTTTTTTVPSGRGTGGGGSATSTTSSGSSGLGGSPTGAAGTTPTTAR